MDLEVYMQVSLGRTWKEIITLLDSFHHCCLNCIVLRSMQSIKNSKSNTEDRRVKYSSHTGVGFKEACIMKHETKPAPQTFWQLFCLELCLQPVKAIGLARMCCHPALQEAILISTTKDYLQSHSTSTTFWPTADYDYTNRKDVFVTSCSEITSKHMVLGSTSASSLPVSIGNWGPRLAKVISAGLNSHVGTIPLKLIRSPSVHCCTVACRCTLSGSGLSNVLPCSDAAEHSCDGMPLEITLLACEFFITSRKLHFATAFDFPMIFLPFTQFSSCNDQAMMKSNALHKVTLIDTLGKELPLTVDCLFNY